MKTIERHRYRDKKIFQTRTLTYEPYPMTEIDSVIGSIVSNLSPEMVTKKYREENASNPMFGHCYHSSQALFYLMDTDVLEQRTAVDYHDCSHWWLVDKTTEKIYDITADQYYSVDQLPPYPGKKKPWYGWKQRPHQRTLDLMVLVLGDRLALDETVNHSV
tara:strand:- start:1647 stop:2129 length:483 start_codon:yes stop_codon:yes gene_type:complete